MPIFGLNCLWPILSMNGGKNKKMNEKKIKQSKQLGEPSQDCQ